MSDLKSEITRQLEAGSCAASELFALQVIDNSMEPEFRKDCIIVIDPDGVVRDGVYVVALIESGYIFRQLKIEDERYFIQPLNEDYLHERREIAPDAIKGIVVQQAPPNGRRKERKKYTYQ